MSDATTVRPTMDFELELLREGPQRLEQLVDKRALADMVASFEQLFGIPMRVVSSSGAVLAEAGPLGDPKLDDDPTREGQADAEGGAVYHVFPIEYDRRPVGRVVLGPYVPAGGSAAFPLPAGAPIMTANRVRAIRDHLAAVLDVILFSGHKAFLTSEMHLASVRESYRELTEKNARLEEAYERLKELDRLKSNFLATVSHELRTPLTSIMGYSEMLAEGVGGPLNGEQREFVETIQNKSEQLLALIISLLDLSKLESGTAPVRLARIEIGPVLEETVSTLSPAAGKKNVELACEVEDGLPLVFGDAVRLRQVFSNLTENAIKFTPPGGSVLLVARAATEAAQTGDDDGGLVLVAPLRSAVEVRVVDTGIGIPEGQREKVFDPFYQIDQSSTREHGGAGLGLAIVKRLVESHQGSVRVEANEPRGAVFVVTLVASRTSTMRPPPRSSVPPVFE
ncbi:MAG TPA: HAMP domain-containing sensor histidine kinase [Minicystis sp.]|nr:HAMP domain-containing sensor histidine kinase [Minicystis sp.]